MIAFISKAARQALTACKDCEPWEQVGQIERKLGSWQYEWHEDEHLLSWATLGQSINLWTSLFHIYNWYELFIPTLESHCGSEVKESYEILWSLQSAGGM